MTYSGTLVESEVSGDLRRDGAGSDVLGMGGTVSGLTTRTHPSCTPRTTASCVSSLAAASNLGSSVEVLGGAPVPGRTGGDKSGAASCGRFGRADMTPSGRVGLH